MKKLILPFVLLFYAFAFSQVGVNTTTPYAQLDVKSSNQSAPANTDGILIPKIDAFPATSPGANQHGMMVYLTTTVGFKPPGFYYWDNTVFQWKPIGGEADYDFLEPASGTPPDDIYDAMYHSGNVGIGVTYPTAKLDVESYFDPAIIQAQNIFPATGTYSTVFKSTISTVNQTGGSIAGFDNYVAPYQNMKGYGIYNTLDGNTSDFIYGIRNNFNNAGSGTRYGLSNNFNSGSGILYGVENQFSIANGSVNAGVRNVFLNTSGERNGMFSLFTGTGNGTIYGTQNRFEHSGNGDIFGTSTIVTAFDSGTGNKYGQFVTVHPSSGGTHYGIYSEVLKSNSFAGFFTGRFAIGTTTSNYYIMPSFRGSANQIMQTDATGNVTWKNPNTALNGFAWTTTGNSGTTAANFIGTTDNAGLIFKVNNVYSGEIQGFSQGFNTFLGYNCGTQSEPAPPDGTNNAGFGYECLSSNTSGQSNAAFGGYSMYSNIDGELNVAIGASALYNNTYGNTNVGLGVSALYNNTLGNGNVAAGYFSLFSNTTGFNNVGIGHSALSSNTTGADNIGIGQDALNSSTNVSGLLAIGRDALYSNTSGTQNTAVGYRALRANTTGSESTAMGYEALFATTGIRNTAVGYNAIRANTTGVRNTAMGTSALTANITGSYNTALGTFAYFNGTAFSNSVAIGDAANITASNQVRIGDGGVTSIGGFANWTNVSDKRFKKDIQQNVPGLEFIKKLNPVTYHLDMEAIARLMKTPEEFRKKDIENEKSQLLQTGFIAQEVEASAKQLGFDFSGVDAPKNDADFYGLRYAEFVVPLVKAVQEQQIIIESDQEKIKELEQKNKELEQRLKAIEEKLSK